MNEQPTNTQPEPGPFLAWIEYECSGRTALTYGFQYAADAIAIDQIRRAHQDHKGVRVKFMPLCTMKAAVTMLAALEAVHRAGNIKDAGEANDAMSDADILVEDAIDQATGQGGK